LRTLCGKLLYSPNVIGLKKFSEVVILLGSLDLFNLCSNCIIVGWSLNVTDNTKSNWETVAIAHQCKLELQGVVLAVSIVNKDILFSDAILANLDNLQTETFLNQTELIVLAEYKWLTMLYIDRVLSTSLLIIYCIMGSVVENNAVLKNLADRCTLVVVCSLEDIDSTRSVSGYCAGKEMSTCAKAELCWTEWILNSSIRT